MLHRLNTLNRFAIIVAGLRAGTLSDFCFDMNWRIRFVTVQMDSGKKGVLQTEQIIGSPNYEEKTVTCAVFPKQTPGEEIPFPESPEGKSGLQGTPVSDITLVSSTQLSNTEGGWREELVTESSSLYSLSHCWSIIKGFSVFTEEGMGGQVSDLIADETTWQIHYVAVSQSSQDHCGSLLLPPMVIRMVQWSEDSIRTRLTREELERVPRVSDLNPVPVKEVQRVIRYFDYLNYERG